MGLEHAKDMAKKMAGLSLQALSRIKQAVNDGSDMDLLSGLELEIDLFLDIFKTEMLGKEYKPLSKNVLPIYTSIENVF